MYIDYLDEDEEDDHLVNENALPPPPTTLFISPTSSPCSSRKYAELDSDDLPPFTPGGESPGNPGRRGSPTFTSPILVGLPPLGEGEGQLFMNDVPTKIEEGINLIDTNSNVLTYMPNIENDTTRNLSPS